MPKCVHDLG